MTQRQIVILLLVATVVGGAFALRLLWIENQEAALSCEGGGGLLCGVRQGVILAFHYHVFGWVSLVAGLFALLRPNPWAAGLALLAGGFGLVLYNTDLAMVGTVLGIIGLARSGRTARQRED